MASKGSGQARPAAPHLLYPPIPFSQFCGCGHCEAMATAVECVCCKSRIFQPRQTDPQYIGCLSEHPDFMKACAERVVVEVSAIERYNALVAAEKTPPGTWNCLPEAKQQSMMRKTAYRRCWLWLYALYLGKGVRNPLPSCMRRVIRNKFPDPHGNYTSFMYADTNWSLCYDFIMNIINNKYFMLTSSYHSYCRISQDMANNAKYLRNLSIYLF